MSYHSLRFDRCAGRATLWSAMLLTIAWYCSGCALIAGFQDLSGDPPASSGGSTASTNGGASGASLGNTGGSTGMGASSTRSVAPLSGGSPSGGSPSGGSVNRFAMGGENSGGTQSSR